jgi:hypothetical protein
MNMTPSNRRARARQLIPTTVLALGLMMAAGTGSALAGQATGPTPASGVTADEPVAPSLDSIRVEQQTLQAAVQANDPAYAHLDAETRQLLLSAQARLFQLIGEHHDIAELRPNDQLRTYNQLQRIKVLLARGEQDVCEQAAIAGTHRQQIACMSQEERDRRVQGARDTLQIRPACTTAECRIGGN